MKTGLESPRRCDNLDIKFQVGATGAAHITINIIYSRKMTIFRHKLRYFFLNFAQNLDCGCSSGSNEYQQSIFQKKNKENNVYPCKP